MRCDLVEKILREVYKAHGFGHGGLRQRRCLRTFRRSEDGRYN